MLGDGDDSRLIPALFLRYPNIIYSDQLVACLPRQVRRMILRTDASPGWRVQIRRPGTTCQESGLQNGRGRSRLKTMEPNRLRPLRTTRRCLAALARSLCGLVVLVASAGAGASETGTVPPRLAALSWLVGHWEGEGTGVSAGSRQRREVLCALDCRYFNIESRILSQPATAVVAREDGPMPTALGMLGTTADGHLVLHTFDTHASVTSYAGAAGNGATLELTAAYRPGRRDGWRARFRYAWSPPDAFHERFEVAQGRGGFAVVAEHQFRRIQAEPEPTLLTPNPASP